VGKAIDDALKQIQASFGKGSAGRLGAMPEVEVEVIPTGAISLDHALGVGGFPRGRIVEVYGPESSGKTTILLQTIANAQAMGLECAYIDTEHALDPIYAKALGVDTDALILSQPDYAEQALNIADRLIKSAELGLLAVDSVAGLTPKAELDGEVGDVTVGLQARLMGQAMRKFSGQLRQHNTLSLWTNQIREKVGVKFGSPETQPGGRALKFYASQRLDVRRTETLKDGTEAVANRTKVTVKKNKVGPPFRIAEFDIDYGCGISTAGCLIDEGLELGLVKKSGGWHAFDEAGEVKANGREAAKTLLDENDELRSALDGAIRERLGLEAK
jgi:recombination protein RecA